MNLEVNLNLFFVLDLCQLLGMDYVEAMTPVAEKCLMVFYSNN